MPLIRPARLSGEPSSKTWVAPLQTEKRLEVALRQEEIKNVQLEEMLEGGRALALRGAGGYGGAMGLGGRRGSLGYGGMYGGLLDDDMYNPSLSGGRTRWPRQTYAARKLSIPLPIHELIATYPLRIPMSAHSHIHSHRIHSHRHPIITMHPVIEGIRPTFVDQEIALRKLEEAALRSGVDGLVDVRMVWSQLERTIIAEGRGVLCSPLGGLGLGGRRGLLGHGGLGGGLGGLGGYDDLDLGIGGYGGRGLGHHHHHHGLIAGGPYRGLGGGRRAMTPPLGGYL
ncbi:hypothetical protein BT69DRAFT_1324819 [Atractiella rhizophila]|nr:hypothetical protein BT69DRAFT_1324819 [Atractiella rhizophila]